MWKGKNRNIFKKYKNIQTCDADKSEIVHKKILSLFYVQPEYADRILIWRWNSAPKGQVYNHIAEWIGIENKSVRMDKRREARKTKENRDRTDFLEIN